jgi:AAHS family benzoate transporter-like MFS transporter
MTLEGCDVIAYGAALPAMLAYHDWGLTVAQAGLIGSLTVRRVFISFVTL